MTQVNLRKGLLGQWTFDDADIDSVRDRIHDRSGYGYDGVMEGGITTGIASPLGNAVSFSGDSAEGIEVGDDGDADSPFQTDTVSAHALVRVHEKPDDSVNNRGIAETHDSAFRPSTGWGFNMNYSEPALEWNLGDGSGDRTLNIRADIDLDRWYLATGRASVEEDKSQFYLDGDFIGELDGIDGEAMSDGDSFSISAGPGGRSPQFDIAYLSVHNRYLSDAELTLLNSMSGQMVSQL